MSTDVLARNATALAEIGAALPMEVLRDPEDVDLLLDHHRVAGVSLRTAGGAVTMQAALNPLREAEAWIPDAALQANTIAVVGAGAGYVIEALERRGYRGRILVLEPSPGSCVAALARHDWCSLIRGRRLRWLVGPDYPGWTDAWTWLTPGEPPGVIIHPVLAKARPQDVRAALEILRKLVFNTTANERARLQFAGPYLLNTITNLPQLLRSHDVHQLEGRFASVPAVIAAAGPSLNRNLEELAPVRDRALLVAVDTALRPCMAAGLEPDFVVAVDPGPLNRRHLAVGTAPPGTWLVAEPSLAPGSFDAFGERIVTYRVGDHEPWSWLQRNGVDRGVLRAWGSVLTTALDFTVHLGCTSIALIGADFGYTGGQPYCRGTAYEDDWARELSTYGTLEAVWNARWRVVATVEESGLGDQPVRATPQLLAFRDWIAGYCAQKTSVRFVNATGAGLMKALPTAQIGDLLADVPPTAIHVGLVASPLPQLLTLPPAIDDKPTTDAERGGSLSSWARVTHVSAVELAARLSPALAPNARASLHGAYEASRASGLAARPVLPVRVGLAATPARAVEIWQALHAQGYAHRHGASFDRRHSVGVERLRKLLALQREDVLLEIGCGDGRLLWHLAPDVRHAIGVDLDDVPLDVARTVLADRSNVTLARGNGLTLGSFESGSVTAVAAFCTFQFMPRLAVADYLTEVERVLAPSGRACLQFFSDGTDDGDFMDEVREQSVSYSPSQITTVVQQAGLRLISIEREDLSVRYPGRDFVWWWVACERTTPSS